MSMYLISFILICTPMTQMSSSPLLPSPFLLLLPPHQVVCLLEELETQRLEAVRQREEASSSSLRQHTAQRDQEGALREARGRLAQLEERAQAEERRRRRLEEEKEVLEERLAQLQGSGAVAPRDVSATFT